MDITTINDTFEYQIKQIFESMKDDYELEMAEKDVNNEPLDTFSNWLWNNKDDLGTKFYDRIDEYLGIDEFTKKYNF